MAEVRRFSFCHSHPPLLLCISTIRHIACFSFPQYLLATFTLLLDVCKSTLLTSQHIRRRIAASNNVMAVNDKSKTSVTNVKILFLGLGIIAQVCCYKRVKYNVTFKQYTQPFQHEQILQLQRDAYFTYLVRFSGRLSLDKDLLRSQKNFLGRKNI
jgi:hypothetical protein